MGRGMPQQEQRVGARRSAFRLCQDKSDLAVFRDDRRQVAQYAVDAASDAAFRKARPNVLGHFFGRDGLVVGSRRTVRQSDYRHSFLSPGQIAILIGTGEDACAYRRAICSLVILHDGMQT